MILYQVYPRSFHDGNGDGVGDLPGIEARLDHIASLGVDMLWIGPVFKSPMQDFGYDVADYRSVDPLFGTLADLDRLIASARDRGMGVMLDMVVSHTSDAHPWFEASRERRDGKDDWYVWADARDDGSPPNNWMSVFGGGAWRWDAVRRQYGFHTFLESQPDLDFHQPDVQEQVLADMAWWLERGVAGFRLDACNHYFQDRLLRSNPPLPGPHHALHPYGFQEHLYDKNQPEVPAFLARVRGLLDRHGAYSVAEVGGSDGARHAIDYVAPGRLHSAYNFDLLRTERSAGYVRGVLERLAREMPGPGVACHALSNHDKPRVATRWGRGEGPQATAAVARQMIALLACLKGSICLYQGEELGLPEAEVPFERLQDPFGRRFWPRFKGRDGCRTPMPWTDGPQAGFSAASATNGDAPEPWLPIDPRHRALNVAAQERDPDSLLHFTRRAFALRRARPELHSGDLVYDDDATGDVPEGLLAFDRRAANRAIACRFNLGDGPLLIDLPSPAEVLLSAGATRVGGQLHLARDGFAVLQIGA